MTAASEAILEMAIAEHSDAEIAEAVHVSRGYIRHVRWKAGIRAAKPAKRGPKAGRGINEKALAIAARIRAMLPDETFAQIGVEFGVTREYVRQMAKKHLGITGRGDLVTARREALAEKVLPLWFAGELTETEIAEQCGCSCAFIAAILDDADVPKDLRGARRGEMTRQGRHRRYQTHEKAKRARSMRENGMSYESIGRLMGCHAPQARHLVLFGGPDPLGREKPFTPRGGASA